MTVHVIYGSDSGRTKAAAGKIAAKLDAKVINIGDATAADFEGCDLLVLGSPTYGEGDLQADWESGVDVLGEADLSGKKVAIFGCGDSASYSGSFCDAMKELYDAAIEAGAEVVGSVSADGYTYDDSAAVVDGRFVGLPLDDVNEDDKSEARIDAWLPTLGF